MTPVATYQTDMLAAFMIPDLDRPGELAPDPGINKAWCSARAEITEGDADVWLRRSWSSEPIIPTPACNWTDEHRAQYRIQGSAARADRRRDPIERLAPARVPHRMLVLDASMLRATPLVAGEGLQSSSPAACA